MSELHEQLVPLSQQPVQENDAQKIQSLQKLCHCGGPSPKDWLPGASQSVHGWACDGILEGDQEILSL